MTRTFDTVDRPLPYLDKNVPWLHRGSVLVDGSQTVDLKLRHSNYMVFLSVIRDPTAQAPHKVAEWVKTSQAGIFQIKTYLSNKFSSEQVVPSAAVDYATAAALPAYTQAGAGTGATLTMNAVGIVTVDGNAIALNDVILVKNGAAGADNGIYKCTTEGTAGVAGVFTRDTGHDTDAEVTAGDWVTITSGDTYAGKGFVISTTGAITVDTTAVTWTQFDDIINVGFLAIDLGAV